MAFTNKVQLGSIPSKNTKSKDDTALKDKQEADCASLNKSDNAVQKTSREDCENIWDKVIEENEAEILDIIDNVDSKSEHKSYLDDAATDTQLSQFVNNIKEIQKKNNSEAFKKLLSGGKLNTDNVVDAVEQIEMQAGESFEEYINSLDIDNSTKEKYINDVYSALYKKFDYNPNYINENVTIKSEGKTTYSDTSYTVKQEDNILTTINNETGQMTQIDVSKMVIGVSSAERIMINSTLQKSPGQLLEFIAKNVNYITSAEGTTIGGYFDDKGICFGRLNNDFDNQIACLAHEIGHSIDSSFNAEAEAYVNFSKETIGKEPYKTEIDNLYATGKFGHYDKGSECEIYAECVRYLMGYGTSEENEYFEKTIPNFLNFVKNTMIYDSKNADNLRKPQHDTSAFENYSNELYRYRKLTGEIILHNTNFKNITVEKNDEGQDIYTLNYSNRQTTTWFDDFEIEHTDTVFKDKYGNVSNYIKKTKFDDEKGNKYTNCINYDKDGNITGYNNYVSRKGREILNETFDLKHNKTRSRESLYDEDNLFVGDIDTQFFYDANNKLLEQTSVESDSNHNIKKKISKVYEDNGYITVKEEYYNTSGEVINTEEYIADRFGYPINL